MHQALSSFHVVVGAHFLQASVLKPQGTRRCQALPVPATPSRRVRSMSTSSRSCLHTTSMRHQVGSAMIGRRGQQTPDTAHLSHHPDRATGKAGQQAGQGIPQRGQGRLLWGRLRDDMFRMPLTRPKRRSLRRGSGTAAALRRARAASACASPCQRPCCSRGRRSSRQGAHGKERTSSPLQQPGVRQPALALPPPLLTRARSPRRWCAARPPPSPRTTPRGRG